MPRDLEMVPMTEIHIKFLGSLYQPCHGYLTRILEKVPR